MPFFQAISGPALQTANPAPKPRHELTLVDDKERADAPRQSRRARPSPGGRFSVASMERAKARG